MLINSGKWVKDNYEWLIKWFDDTESVSKEEIENFNNTHCMIFKDILHKQEDYDRVLREHIMTILLACIWSTYFKKNLGDHIITCMDGFYKLRNRLPLPEDKVGIRYFGEDKKGIRMLRFKKSFDEYPYGEFLSDCRLEIVN